MATQSQKNNRLLFLLIAIALLVAAFGIANKMRGVSTGSTTPVDNAAVLAQLKQLKIDGTVLDTPRVIAPFTLTDMNGQAFTLNNFKHRWSLVFFGFTNCGFVCPTSMAGLNKMYQALAQQLPQDLLPQVVMISVDPRRDTVARMKEYVTSYNPHFIGARAEKPAVDALAHQMSAVYTQTASTDGNPNHYTINHSAEVMLVDPQAQLRAFFSYPHNGPTMAHDYQSIISVLNGHV